MKNPSQDMWKDMWCGRWNEKMFKDIALCSLFYFSSKEKEGKKRDGEYSSKKIHLKKRECTPTRARRQRTDPPSNSPFHRDGTTKKTFSRAFYPSFARVIFGIDATTGASLALKMPSKGRENNGVGTLSLIVAIAAPVRRARSKKRGTRWKRYYLRVDRNRVLGSFEFFRWRHDDFF